MKIETTPIRIAQCHCKDCQRASETGHMSLAFFSEADVTIEGETASYACTTDSGNTSTRHFCPSCGSRLFGRNSGRPGLLTVTAGCFDDNSWFKPQMVLYTSLRHEWDVTSTDVPNFDKMPPPA